MENCSPVKKKRRSSFVAGRLSAKSGGHGTSDLYMNVPTILPPEERFLRILQVCYEKAAETVGQEFFPSTGMMLPEFIVNASEAFDDIKELLEEKKICQLATLNNTAVKIEPRLIDLEIKNYEEYAKRLSRETAIWNKIENEENENLTTERRSVADTAPITISLPETGEEFFYDALVADISKGEQVVARMLSRVQEVGSLFHGIEDAAEDFFKYQRNILGTIPFSTVDDTPRTLVKNAARLQ